MRVRVARRAGFCWGVRRAMNAALEGRARYGRRNTVKTLGPLIHNPQALEHLARRGVQEATDPTAITNGALVTLGLCDHASPPETH
jgi:4-hydroxy-3-methylbut-2-enyl diphosphate reductase